MEIILHLYDKARALIQKNMPISTIMELGLFDKVVKMKYDIPNDHMELFDEYFTEIDNKLADAEREFTLD